jgi:dihydrodipicolinate synthase/N-acetylneuraminate lyase
LPELTVAYYNYRVFAFARLEKVAQFDAFKDASAEAKRLRAAASPAADGKIKVVFAENEFQAEDLLSQVRTGEAGVVGDE